MIQIKPINQVNIGVGKLNNRNKKIKTIAITVLAFLMLTAIMGSASATMCTGSGSCSEIDCSSCCVMLGCSWDYDCYDGSYDCSLLDPTECSICSMWCSAGGTPTPTPTGGGGGGTDCWNYYTQATCEADPECIWDDEYGECYHESCWIYDNTDQDTCESNTEGWDCVWDDPWCNEKSCWSYDNTNESACENNTDGFPCVWDDPWCKWKSCWDHSTKDDCEDASMNCMWDLSDNYCYEFGCWNWDHTSQAECEDDTDTYGLDCMWHDDGLCDPTGFYYGPPPSPPMGGGGQMGAMCWEFDDNEDG